MDERRKNPYRRPDPSGTSPGERRPGLRQLPKDLEDLALGKADRLRRPRRERPALQDEREGAVIPGVRNLHARAVYDARVNTLRAALAAGREDELRDGLEEVRRLALWRARNVTDFRAFAESVVGVAPELAQRLGEAADADTSAPLPEHAIALALRLEAALVARVPGARVRLHSEDAGTRLSLSLPAHGGEDVARAVEALSDAGHAAAGLRQFLRGPGEPLARASAEPSAGTDTDEQAPEEPAHDEQPRDREPRSFERPHDRDTRGSFPRGPQRKPFRDQARDDAFSRGPARKPFRDQARDDKFSRGPARKPFRDQTRDEALSRGPARKPFRDQTRDEAFSRGPARKPFRDQTREDPRGPRRKPFRDQARDEAFSRGPARKPFRDQARDDQRPPKKRRP